MKKLSIFCDFVKKRKNFKNPLHFRFSYAILFGYRKILKKGIHPEYKDTVITCACGAEYPTRSTKADLHVDICAKCHPFYTGKQKFVDAGGRVDKFKKRYDRT